MKSLSVLAIFSALLLASSCHQVAEIPKPGQYQNFTLLPNGWKLTPVGKQVGIGELPLNMLVLNDYLLVTSNSGVGEHSLSLVNFRTEKEVQRIHLAKTWRGLAWDKTGQKLFVSGGNDNFVYGYHLQADTLHFDSKIELPPSGEFEHSVSGLAWWPEGKRLLVVTKTSKKFFAIDPVTASTIHMHDLKGKAFDIIVLPKQNLAALSDWENGTIELVDLLDWKPAGSVRVGQHPCEMIVSNDEKFLYVANANQNTVSVVNLEMRQVIETLNSALRPDLPPGSTPNSLAFGIDEKNLYIANADNNSLSVFNIETPGKSHSLGFIPTGWYPTAVRFVKKSGILLVANGKGLGSRPNPAGPRPGEIPARPKELEEYIGRLFKGAISVIQPSDLADPSRLSVMAMANNPLTKKNDKESAASVIPAFHDGTLSTQIRHVFYIIKENRTYDQVFGDLKQGLGDPDLCLFPDSVTPNMHRLAQDYVLFDNFYVDAEVSADGHNWSTAAYATDYTEKTWPTLYGGRGGQYEYEGGVAIARPENGYIWDSILKKGLSYRSYGEFVQPEESRPGKFKANDEYLESNICTTFPGYNLSVPDTLRFQRWRTDFDSLVSIGNVPALSIIRLPNDHTAGTRKGFPTVTSMVAENDYALGLLVEHLSHSPVWPNSVMFVLEDDAQNGSDHIDAHRSPLLVIGPHVRRGVVDHRMYSTSSVLKTIALIHGLPPLSQYDLAANSLIPAFQDKPDPKTYQAIPLQIAFRMNHPEMYGAARCEEFNLSVEDAIPDVEFNEVIWKAVRGAESAMPAPVRSAWIRYSTNDEDVLTD
jgi:DNA-binding beta-propeller fold protein YncE